MLLFGQFDLSFMSILKKLFHGTHLNLPHPFATDTHFPGDFLECFGNISTVEPESGGDERLFVCIQPLHNSGEGATNVFESKLALFLIRPFILGRQQKFFVCQADLLLFLGLSKT